MNFSNLFPESIQLRFTFNNRKFFSQWFNRMCPKLTYFEIQHIKYQEIQSEKPFFYYSIRYFNKRIKAKSSPDKKQ
jgi:hypothetical protein